MDRPFERDAAPVSLHPPAHGHSPGTAHQAFIARRVPGNFKVVREVTRSGDHWIRNRLNPRESRPPTASISLGSILQFSQQLCEQLHARVPALAHAVYSGAETSALAPRRVMARR